MAHCSSHLPGVELIQLEEYQDWHKCPKVFDHYDIQFVLPVCLGIKYWADDPLLEYAFKGDLHGLQTASEAEVINYRDKNGNTLLTLASYSGQLDVVEWLHHKGISVNQRSSTGVTALLAAVGKNHIHLVDWLVCHNANVNDCNDEGFTPLLLSSYNGNWEIAATLVQEGGLVNFEDNTGKTALMIACQRGHPTVVEQLINAHANVLKASSGPPAPFYAAVTGNSNCLSPLTLFNNKVLEVCDQQGWCLLAAAAYHGNLDFVKEMHRLGANLDQRDKFGRTALMAAAEMGHYAVAHYLVQHRASVNIQSKSGMSAFDLALSEGYTEITSLLVKHITATVQNKTRSSALVMACRAGDIAVAQYLVKGGSEVNQQNNVGVTPLIASCMSGNIALTEYLIEVGADVRMKTVNNLNVYQVAFLNKDYQSLEFLEPHFASEISTLCCHIPVAAACLGDISVLRNLLQRGEDINAPVSKGITALMIASHCGYQDIAIFLMNNNADISAETEGGATALSYAIDANNRDMVDLLIGHGASVNRKNSSGFTLCHLLTTSKKMDLLARVVQFGGDINCPGPNGVTPLMMACQQGSFDLVKYFVGLNVSIGKRCANDYDAVTYAFMNDNTSICNYLTDAAKKNPESHMRLFLRFYGSRYEASDDDSPFYKACIAGELSLVQDLVREGQNIHVPNNNDVNALHYATFHGHEELAQWLLDNGALVNATTKDGVTPLMIACHEGQEDMVELLIRNKCLINLRDSRYQSALTFVVAHERTIILRILLQQNPAIDLVDNDGSSPLNLACRKGLLDIVMVLVENHADINRTDAYGCTSLMAAARNGHNDVVEFLVQEGADVGTISGEGKTAADYAHENNHLETSHCIRDAAMLQGVTLVEVDAAPPSSSTKDSLQNRFFAQCENGQDLGQLAELIESDEVDVNGRNGSGETGLLLAVMGGHLEVTDILLSKNVDLGVSSNSGVTPLMFAVETGYMDIVVKLVENGADLKMIDQFGNDIISLAADSKHQGILQYLIRKSEEKGSESPRSAVFNTSTYVPIESGQFLEHVQEDTQSTGADWYNEETHLRTQECKQDHEEINCRRPLTGQKMESLGLWF